MPSSTATSPYQRGTAQAALRHRNFRIIYFGTFASNIGTWMQNVVLGAYALKLTGSPGVRRPASSSRSSARCCSSRRPVGCSPTSSTGAGCSSACSSRRWCFSFGLAVARADRRPVRGRTRGARVRDRYRERARCARLERDPADARAARGPARCRRARVGADEPVAGRSVPRSAASLYAALDAAPVFALNASTYLLRDRRSCCGRRYPRPRRRPGRRAGPAAAALGRSDRAPRSAASPRSWSRCSRSRSSRCAFVGLMPVIADQNFGLDPKSTAYGVLYACFGLGAALGAITVGTVFARAPRPRCCDPVSSRSRSLLTAFALIRARGALRTR